MAGDRFEELTGLMKAKKPYNLVSTPVLRTQTQTAAPNGSRSASRVETGSSIPSPSATPLQVGETVASFIQEQEPGGTESLRKELFNAKKQKLELESQLSNLERSNTTLRDVHRDIGVQIGKLKYQNEANKSQKAAMGQSLSEKDLKIKTQQLEIEKLVRQLGAAKAKFKELDTSSGDINYARGIKIATSKEYERALSDLTATKDRELNELKHKIQEQESTIDRVTHERDEASRTQANSGDHINRIKNLVDTLAQHEKTITDLRSELVVAQLKVTELADDLEAVKGKNDQSDIDDLKNKLLEKTSVCDRLRYQLRMTEAQLKQSQSRLMQIANNGISLRGAAHVVKPAESTQLPRTVISCTECYKNNFSCDNAVECRNCSERNTTCARWMCSLKHKYGECPLSPCPHLHDPQGWLMLRYDRPQW